MTDVTMTQEDFDHIAAPLFALMQRLDDINAIWTKFTVERTPDGQIHIMLADAFSH